MAITARLEQDWPEWEQSSAEHPSRQRADTAVAAGVSLVAAGELAAARRELQELRQAVTSNRAIGTVIGLLACRYRCSTTEAGSLLWRISQNSNLKVARIASVLQAAFDGAELTGERMQVLQVVCGQLPAGGWPPHDAPDGRCP